jgi:mevalonate pyrophosphate decarboxylase
LKDEMVHILQKMQQTSSALSTCIIQTIFKSMKQSFVPKFIRLGSSSSSLPFTSLALSMLVKSVSQMVPHDHWTKRIKATKAAYA